VRVSTKPLSPGRFKLELTLGQDTHDKLEQLRELLRHQNPSGDLTSIVERALSELLEVHHHEATFARGGAATADNLRLACRAHNLFLAEQDYGGAFMQRKVRDAIARRACPERARV
jgi:hypothetical protein